MRTSVSLWSIGPSVLLPSLLFGIGQGAIAPIVVLSARELGASVAVASMMVGAIGFGRILGDVPAGMLAERVGERRAMLLAVVFATVALIVCITAQSVWVFAVAVAGTGVATAVFSLARHTYVTEIIPYQMRARAMSTLGGTQRIGFFVGPFLGAATMGWLGTDGGYWVHLVGALAAAIALLTLSEVPNPNPAQAKVSALAAIRLIRPHVPVLRTLGMGTLLVGAVRASRQVVIPLWAESIGLDTATASLIFGISGLFDMLLFYPGGLAMDRFGRRWVAIPSMILLGSAHLALPITASAGMLATVAVAMGAGNGLSSGINATVGADASPAIGRSAFLGVWRLCGDIGRGTGPIAIGALAAVASLSVAVMAMGAVSGLAAAAMARWIPPFRQPR